jgi:ribosomal protein S18 acetylase RimI-like enzyme
MKTPIEYRLNFPVQAVAIVALFENAGLPRPTKDLVRIEKIFANSDIVFSAWHSDTLVGICRVITDFGFSCYLPDLAVAKAFQRQGIGRTLINHVRSTIGDEVSLVLLSVPDAAEYYKKLGFQKIDDGFIMKRRR